MEGYGVDVVLGFVVLCPPAFARVCGHFENDSISALRTTRFRFENDSISDLPEKTYEFRLDFFADSGVRKMREGQFSVLLSPLRLACPASRLTKAELTRYEPSMASVLLCSRPNSMASSSS